MEAVHVLVSGTVQGVGFRATCRRAAASAGVTGWVRNLDDGRVEAVFAGSPAAVESMVGWCRSGPGAATVEAVRVDRLEAPPSDLAERFEVR
ncbi:MAG: acylphosphatase [Citricoccus sp.]|jgi:acylphosphatase|nr:acylphosphatase [Citricoccus sp. WCRC_4]